MTDTRIHVRCFAYIFLSNPNHLQSVAFESICDNVKKIRVKNMIYDFCPALKWVPEYPIRKNLMSDFVAGFTVAIMHIPQVKNLLILLYKYLKEILSRAWHMLF